MSTTALPVPGEAILIAAAVFAGTAARFVEGLRRMNGFLAGMAGMHWAKFLAFNALGAMLWAGTRSAVGHFAGDHIETIHGGFDRYKWLAIATLPVLAGIVVTRRVRRRHAETAA